MSLVFDEDFGLADGQEINFDTSTGTRTTVQLTPGRWHLYATQDCWVKQGVSPPSLSNSTKSGQFASFMKGGTAGVYYIQITPRDPNVVLQAIGDTASGVLHITRVSRAVSR
jgi:hypothetical protein